MLRRLHEHIFGISADFWPFMCKVSDGNIVSTGSIRTKQHLEYTILIVIPQMLTVRLATGVYVQ